MNEENKMETKDGSNESVMKNCPNQELTSKLVELETEKINGKHKKHKHKDKHHKKHKKGNFFNQTFQSVDIYLIF